jgi:hypothetical protein
MHRLYTYGICGGILYCVWERTTEIDYKTKSGVRSFLTFIQPFTYKRLSVEHAIPIG